VKLRIQRNSLRLRVSQSELARFVECGFLEETIYFCAESGFTYALVRDDSRRSVGVESSAMSVIVTLPEAEVRTWSQTEQVGIAGEVDFGPRGILAVLVEKDFACLDRSGEENADTFPNPLAAHIC
jgi:hypothetical protein